MKRCIILCLVVGLSFLSAKEQDWNTTSFEKYWNKFMHPMTFRDPVWLTPFQLRVGPFYYGGPEYWQSFSLADINGSIQTNDDSAILMDSTETSLPSILSFERRTGVHFEIDIARVNYPLILFHQNIFDIQIGLGYGMHNFGWAADLPSHWKPPLEEVRGGSYKFDPLFHHANLVSSISWQRSKYWLLTATHSIGKSWGRLYKSKGGDVNLNCSGLNETIGFGINFLLPSSKLSFSYLFGIEAKFSRIYVNSVDDPQDISPIIGIDMRTMGVYLTFGTAIGGTRTTGDSGFDDMNTEDYISAAKKLEVFVKEYPSHGRTKKAEELLDFCYEQIPYQFFDIGLQELKAKNYSTAISNFESAYFQGDDDLKFEVDIKLADIANILLDSAEVNQNSSSYTQTENLIQKAWELTSRTRKRANEVLANLYIDKGNALLSNRDYSGSLDYYNQALDFNPNLNEMVMKKYKDIAEGLIADINYSDEYSDVFLVLESLKSIEDVQPKLKKLTSNLITLIKDKLDKQSQTEMMGRISELMLAEKKKLYMIKKYRLQLGMLPSEVKEILGEPEHLDYLTDNGKRFEMWSYQTEDGVKRLYFEDHYLVKIQMD
ncbi:MAG: hypothetical protein ISR90_01855 [Candidatus Marinimicrobia bacterium]|nr:hypothetical protein [Candidatus Neomarinimicrobiota bacterium]MBL7022788.1 hypothetical protein [Candidatus Neomarinimicrobiota bacterium]